MVDSKTDKAIVSPKWNELFTLGMNIFNVSGNKPEKMLNSTQSRKAFVNDQSLAMIVHQFNAMLPELQVMKANGVNYDLSAPPRHASTPDTKAPNSYNHLVVGKSTKYPEQAFQFVSSILTDDVQSVSSRNGRIPVIINPGVQKLFGQDNEYFKGKNIDALFAKGKVREEREGGPYDAIVQSKIVEAFNAVYQGTDINTALRNAEEAANKAIAAEKAK
jgi:multiple sugar transport system substrate-binding protein